MTSPVTAENVSRHVDARSIALYSREQGMRLIEKQLIREFAPAVPGSILDLGCGAGRTTQTLARAGWRAVGLDLSEPLLRVARQRAPEVPYILADAAALTFPANCFDAVLFSFNGIDYLHPEPAREQCFREVHNVLKPGGVFIFSSHNLIGAIFSGGYFYLRGYFNALRFLASQAGNPYWRDWYMTYEEFSGPHVLFSAPPSRTVDQLVRAGFAVEDVRGANRHRDRRAVLMHEAHVYFVARKPAA